MLRRTISIMVILIMVCCVLNWNSGFDVRGEEYDEAIIKALEEERYYNENFYDEEPEDYEEYDYNSCDAETSINELGEANLRYTTTNINGDNLSYDYKITNIPSINSSNPAIQKTYIGDNYLFYIQRQGTTLYLSRVSLPTSGNVINASGASRMTLTNFGHSQVLEYFSYNGESYFWIGCKASSESYNWSTQLARVKFVAGGTTDYTACKRLSSMNCANQTGTSLGTVRRVEAALSTNKSYLLVWVRTYQIDENGNKSYYKTRFSIYNATSVNNALTAYTASNHVPCTDSSIKAACISSFEYVPGDSSEGVLRYGSNQGLEINNSKQIYVASEARSNGQSQGKYIYKLSSSGTILKRVFFTGNTMGVGSTTEMEGLQIKDSKLYFALKDHSSGINNIHYIYKIDPSYFD
ncbi:hypothetical protein SAMN02745111_02364 [Eubacterium uniforme]|uniref:Uncharacterized protein n=1 Tax=Eubacterium uniforme TaxID=39495 RepID=A0A1T4W5E7_9FIRM|nr:helveticin J family class III bacteriocin [Eubacterium uniforme]SKA72500.1 hypothetical protein SAMN02745111_02364 [Eubacterium uniforme]